MTDFGKHTFAPSEWVKEPDDVVPMAMFLATQPDIGPTAPIVGASKAAQMADAVAAVTLTLSDDEVSALEAPYVPHAVVGFE